MGLAGMISRGRSVPKYTCDICGAFLDARPGVFRMVRGRVVCNHHPDYVPAEAKEGISIKTFKVSNLQNARPFNPRNTYEASEYEIFNFLLYGPKATGGTITPGSVGTGRPYAVDQYNVRDFSADAEANSVFLSNGAWSAAWTAIYLYELLAENKRPSVMLEVARAKLREIADFLLVRQNSGPFMPGTIPNDPAWGGWADTVGAAVTTLFYRTYVTAACGIAMLRAYQLLGDVQYLECARAAAWFSRTAQCGGLLAAFGGLDGYYTSDSAGTNRKQWGTWDRLIRAGSLALSATSPSGILSVETLLFFEFLAIYREVVGDEVIGSSHTDPSGFEFSRACTVSSAIDEAMSFWNGTVFDVAEGGPINGLTTTTPFEYFQSYFLFSSPSFAGKWGTILTSDSHTNVIVQSETWAMALRGLMAVEGISSRVTTLFDFLMSFTSNPTFELQSSVSDKAKYAPLETRGTYDPRLALSDGLECKRLGLVTNTNATASPDTRRCYALYTAGLLAPLYASRQPAKFKDLKDTLAEPRHHTVGRGEDGRYHYLGPMSRCGFSFQPTQANGRFRVPSQAAMLGLIYRHGNTAFTGKGH
jgi:hypothetical protein